MSQPDPEPKVRVIKLAPVPQSPGCVAGANLGASWESGNAEHKAKPHMRQKSDEELKSAPCCCRAPLQDEGAAA